MPAGARVDRADVQAGAAADAVQRLAADLVAEHARAAVVEQHDVQLLRPVAGSDAGPERRVRVHPLAGRGARQQLQEHLEIGEGRHELLDAEHASRAPAAASCTCGRCPPTRRRRPFPVSATPKFAPLTPTRALEEPLAQVEPRGLGEVARVVRGEIPGAIVRANRSRISRSVAVDRRHEDVRRPVAVELEDQLGEVGLERMDARPRQRLVEPDLVGRQRLHLHDLGRPRAPGRPRRRSRSPRRASRAQWTWPPAASTAASNCDEVLVEVARARPP